MPLDKLPHSGMTLSQGCLRVLTSTLERLSLTQGGPDKTTCRQRPSGSTQECSIGTTATSRPPRPMTPGGTVTLRTSL